MTQDSLLVRERTPSCWAPVLVVAASLAAGGTATVYWLLWEFVPLQAEMFMLLGVGLPRSTRLAVAMSNAFVRHLPFMTVALTVLGAVASRPVIGTLRAAGARALRCLAVAAVVILCLQAAVGGFVLYAVHEAYASVLSNKALEQALQDFSAYRKTR